MSCIGYFEKQTRHVPQDPYMVYIYIPTWMVGFFIYGLHVGKYTSPMDPMDVSRSICWHSDTVLTSTMGMDFDWMCPRERTTELRIEDGGKSQDVWVSPVEQQKAPWNQQQVCPWKGKVETIRILKRNFINSNCQPPIFRCENVGFRVCVLFVFCNGSFTTATPKVFGKKRQCFLNRFFCLYSLLKRSNISFSNKEINLSNLRYHENTSWGSIGSGLCGV